MKREISCGGVVYYQNDVNQIKYLVIKNLHAKYYGFPKGHVENNESFEQTAVREIFEETGINVTIEKIEYMTNSYYINTNTIKEVHYFLTKAQTLKLTLQASEVADAAWLSKKEVIDLLTHQNDKEIFMLLTKDLE